MTCLLCCRRIPDGAPTVILTRKPEPGVTFDAGWTGWAAHASCLPEIEPFHYSDAPVEAPTCG